MSYQHNISIAQKLLAGIGGGEDPDTIAQMFDLDLKFEIQGDAGVLPWIGHQNGRNAAAAFFRQIRILTEPLKFDVEDILGSDDRAAIIGALETRINSSGKIMTSQFAIILTIANGRISRFQMLEDSFGLSQAVRK
jgi:ketosteroid isomerase-like protein